MPKPNYSLREVKLRQMCYNKSIAFLRSSKVYYIIGV